mmetsp:Transcript_20209/g.56180  ORF Transcript_20209/g.56180 Transcript_20209/m.56180 type:complete len:251 (+) Transcript_20209:1107-1859(+)
MVAAGLLQILLVKEGSFFCSISNIERRDEWLPPLCRDLGKYKLHCLVGNGLGDLGQLQSLSNAQTPAFDRSVRSRLRLEGFLGVFVPLDLFAVARDRFGLFLGAALSFRHGSFLEVLQCPVEPAGLSFHGQGLLEDKGCLLLLRQAVRVVVSGIIPEFLGAHVDDIRGNVIDQVCVVRDNDHRRRGSKAVPDHLSEPDQTVHVQTIGRLVQQQETRIREAARDAGGAQEDFFSLQERQFPAGSGVGIADA